MECLGRTRSRGYQTLEKCGRKHNLDTGANRAVLSSGGEARPQLGLQVEEMCNVQSKSQ